MQLNFRIISDAERAYWASRVFFGKNPRDRTAPAPTPDPEWVKAYRHDLIEYGPLGWYHRLDPDSIWRDLNWMGILWHELGTRWVYVNGVFLHRVCPVACIFAFGDGMTHNSPESYIAIFKEFERRIPKAFENDTYPVNRRPGFRWLNQLIFDPRFRNCPPCPSDMVFDAGRDLTLSQFGPKNPLAVMSQLFQLLNGMPIRDLFAATDEVISEFNRIYEIAFEQQFLIAYSRECHNGIDYRCSEKIHLWERLEKAHYRHIEWEKKRASNRRMKSKFLKITAGEAFSVMSTLTKTIKSNEHTDSASKKRS